LINNVTLWLDCEQNFCVGQDPQCDRTGSPTINRDTTDAFSPTADSSVVKVPTVMETIVLNSTLKATDDEAGEFYAPIYEAMTFTDKHPPHVLAIVLTALVLSLLIAGGMAYNVWTNFRQTGKNRSSRTRVATQEDEVSLSGFPAAPEGWLDVDVGADVGGAVVQFSESLEAEPEEPLSSGMFRPSRSSRGDEGETHSVIGVLTPKSSEQHSNTKSFEGGERRKTAN
jgi:hypothetical protein